MLLDCTPEGGIKLAVNVRPVIDKENLHAYKYVRIYQPRQKGFTTHHIWGAHTYPYTTWINCISLSNKPRSYTVAFTQLTEVLLSTLEISSISTVF